jgi:CheY-like chemotaxis protein
VTDSEAQPHRCTILVIDDDREAQEMLRIALAADGFTVATAANGRDGIDYLRSHAETCAILLDLMLPGMDGPGFRAVQRRDRSLSWIPVIVMSAALDGDRRARDLAPEAFLRKPIDLDQLREAVGLVARQNCRNGIGAAELAARKPPPLSSG